MVIGLLKKVIILLSVDCYFLVTITILLVTVTVNRLL